MTNWLPEDEGAQLRLRSKRNWRVSKQLDCILTDRHKSISTEPFSYLAVKTGFVIPRGDAYKQGAG